MNMSISKGVGQHHEQNVHFSDQTADWSYRVPSQPDDTFKVADTTDATLEEFFSRPVRIHSFTWTPGVAAFEFIDPWSLFFHNLRVVNRINNYNLLRAKLHIKIVINGNGFYFGRMLASYLPRPTLIFGAPLPRALVPQDLIQMSQLPHVYLDPTTSQGGELELPFFHIYNALSIPENDFSQMGALTFKTLTPLAHANNGTNPVTVTVFAWATDVSLSIPTSTRNGSLAPQMGDEYGVGPVSRPANTIARAAGSLAKIPVIAPYAKATQMAAKAVGDVASIFGYSRPTQVTQSNTIKPEYVGVLANVNVPDNATKLTLDCKQEVTVDPRVVGLESADEMSILSLAKRESYYGSFLWADSDAPDAVLYSKYVTPITFDTYGVPGALTEEYHLTPTCFAALPFKYWRGTLRFRFQIVASAFHKGRIKIVYDPALLQSASVGEYNINYSYVADLASDRDFTLEFGWGQKNSWASVSTLQNMISPAGVAGTVLTTSPTSVGANGLFSVVVVNELTSTSDQPVNIFVNMFISACDDFEVCVPSCSNIANLSWSPGVASVGPSPGLVAEIPKFSRLKLEPQMGEESDPVDTSVESAPTLTTAMDTMAPMLPVDHTLDVFFGDPVTSFRQCLKRYEFSRAWAQAYNGGSPYLLYRYRLPDVPLYQGAVGGAIDVALGDGDVPKAWNFVKFTLLNYLLPAYAGRRGGLRWKYHLNGVQNAPASLSITKGGAGEGYEMYNEAVVDNVDDQPFLRAERFNNFFPHTWCATHVTDVRNNPVIEAELPYYESRRFIDCRDTNVTSDDRFSTAYHYLHAHVKLGDGDDPLLMSYVATAEDFNLYFFSGVPPIYTITQPYGLVLE